MTGKQVPAQIKTTTKGAREKTTAKPRANPDPSLATPKALAAIPMADRIPVHCAHSAIVPTDDVRPYPQNANDHPEEQVLRLAKLILKHGWRVPITISNQTGYVVRGHGRLLAARRLKAARVPVDYQDYPDERMERADRAADNLIAELAETNRALLKDLVLDLDDGSFDLDLLGQTPDFFEELMTAAPPPSAQTGGTPDSGSSTPSAAGSEPGESPSGLLQDPLDVDRRSPAPLVAKLTIPPQSWLVMRERLIGTINTACEEFGAVVQWPE